MSLGTAPLVVSQTTHNQNEERSNSGMRCHFKFSNKRGINCSFAQIWSTLLFNLWCRHFVGQLMPAQRKCDETVHKIFSASHGLNRLWFFWTKSGSTEWSFYVEYVTKFIHTLTVNKPTWKSWLDFFEVVKISLCHCQVNPHYKVFVFPVYDGDWEMLSVWVSFCFCFFVPVNTIFLLCV